MGREVASEEMEAFRSSVRPRLLTSGWNDRTFAVVARGHGTDGPQPRGLLYLRHSQPHRSLSRRNFLSPLGIGRAAQRPRATTTFARFTKSHSLGKARREPRPPEKYGSAGASPSRVFRGMAGGSPSRRDRTAS